MTEGSFRKMRTLASAGLATGALFGLAGSMFQDIMLQSCLYEISSVGLITASALLSIYYLQSEKEFVASGFLLLAIAEGVMSGGTSAGQAGAQPTFAAGMALYVPALLLIGLPSEYPVWARVAGIAATIPFAVASAKIFMGEQVFTSTPLAGAGYGLMTIAIAGWIWKLLRTSSFK